MHANPIVRALSACLLAWGCTAVTQATAAAPVPQPAGTQTAKAAGKKEAKAQLATRAAEVLDEIMQAPDQGIPLELLNRAECVAVFPSTFKAGFLVGVAYGYGVVSCRQPGSDGWGAPAFFTLAGGSVGLQIGAKATDLIFLVMNENGVNSVLRSKVALGADIGVTAGPVGRDASAATDLLLGAGLLSYSHSEGIFAGFNLDGSVLRYDAEATEEVYGEQWEAQTLLFGGKESAPNLGAFVEALGKYAPPRIATR